MAPSSGSSDWDKTTYRVTRIPKNLDAQSLSSVLADHFNLTLNDLKVHSLAFDVPNPNEPLWLAATISFRTRPSRFQASQGETQEWDVDIASEPSRHDLLYFDTHFDGFTPVSSAANDADHDIDCIVIPGWGGHALGSFRSPISSYVWLRDSLPINCPRLRMWLYGYTSDLLNKKLSGDVYEFAERFRKRLRILRRQTTRDNETKPLIFMAHSLGGWIFMDTMSRLKESSDENDALILQSTYGALLFGVPAYGMNAQAIKAMLGDLPGSYISHLLDLDDGFRLRQGQHETFCKAFNFEDSRIVSFYELEKSRTVIQEPKTKIWSRKGPLTLLVEPQSAFGGRAWENTREDVLSLSGDHSSMVKFWSPSHSDYGTVCGVVQTFIERAHPVISARLHHLSIANISVQPIELTYDEKESLRSLYFPEMDWYRNGLVDFSTDTCDWITAHQNYQEWFSQCQGLLWISGKPGAGKSIVMKHALECAEQVSKHPSVCASFFFLRRGSLIQKSVLGLFKSLLYQILRAIPELLSLFTSAFKKKCEAQGALNNTWRWDVRELQDFFKNYIVEAAKKYPIRLYIDALDEGGDEITFDLIKFFQRFANSVAVCFSCRSSPLISLKNGLEICVERENEVAIDTYIGNELDVVIRRPDVAKNIRDAVVPRSRGIFLWVVLVIRQVLKSYRKGKGLAFIQNQIQETPQGLDEFYGAQLEDLDEEERSQSLQLLQWICFALRPLSLIELSYAMAVDADSEFTSIAQILESEVYVDPEVAMENRVHILSKGLVKVTEAPSTDRSEMVVEFIHESVYDYFRNEGIKFLHRGPIEAKITSANFRLSRSCIKYLAMEEIRSATEEWTLEDDSELLNSEPFPFSQYAVDYWISHVQKVEEEGIPQHDLAEIVHSKSYILETCGAMGGGQRYIRIDHSYFLEDKYSYSKRGTTLLHIGARYGLFSVVDAVLLHSVEVDPRDQDNRTPLWFAAAEGKKAMVERLVNRGGVDINWKNVDGDAPLHAALRNNHEETALYLLQQYNIERDIKGDLGQTPLYLAARAGCKVALKALLDQKDVNVCSISEEGETPLEGAIFSGCGETAIYLLQQTEIKKQLKGGLGTATFTCAASYENEAVFKMLLDHKYVDVNSTHWSSGFETPLQQLARCGNEKLTDMLLSRSDIDVNLKNQDGDTPLHLAVESQSRGVVSLLVRRPDIEGSAKNRLGQTPLYSAVRLGNKEIIALLPWERFSKAWIWWWWIYFIKQVYWGEPDEDIKSM